LRLFRRLLQRAPFDDAYKRAFHDRVLEDGALPMPALAAKIERWIASAPPG
jgi:uncharacterized protein (DUF885 family)